MPVTHNPVKGVKRPKAETNEGKTPALGDHQARKLLILARVSPPFRASQNLRIRAGRCAPALTVT
jgi:hypothetical protein